MLINKIGKKFLPNLIRINPDLTLKDKLVKLQNNKKTQRKIKKINRNHNPHIERTN